MILLILKKKNQSPMIKNYLKILDKKYLIKCDITIYLIKQQSAFKILISAASLNNRLKSIIIMCKN